MQDEIRVPIATDRDIVAARGEGRALAGRLGFRRTDATLIATAISELGRNIVVHAGSGEILLRAAVEDDRSGVVVIARDKGPGIRDVADALRDGYGTKNGLGLGLPGSRRIMEDFRIDTEVGRGTTVAICMWRVRDELERLREARAFPRMSEPPSARDAAPMPRSPSPNGRRHSLGARLAPPAVLRGPRAGVRLGP